MDTIEHADMYLLLIRSSGYMAFPTLQHRFPVKLYEKDYENQIET